MSSLGSLIRSLRQERGLSYRALAARAGVGHTTLLKWEAGTFLPRLPELKLVLNALEVTDAVHRQAIESLNRPRALAHIRAQVGQELATAEIAGQGDLLRVLRRRQKQTLEQLAIKLNVATRTISRWERGDQVPSTVQLHALCHALGATAEEVALLTVGQFPHGERMASASLDQLQAIFHEQWSYPQPATKVARSELTFLALAAHVQVMSWRNPAAIPLLVDIYAALANHYFVTDFRPKRVLHFSEQTMRAARSLLRLSYAAVAGIARYGSVAAPVAGLQALIYWSDFTPDVSCHAWFLSLQAESASRMKSYTEADHYSLQAIQMTTHNASEDELIGRRMDRAKLLISWNRVADALPLLRPLVADTMPNEPLLWAKAMHALGDRQEAAKLLNHTFQRLDALGDTFENMAPYFRQEAAPLVKALF